MRRGQPTQEAVLIGQALFARDGQPKIDPFLRLRDSCNLKTVLQQLVVAFTSSVPIEQKITAYHHLCRLDQQKKFINGLHGYLPAILASSGSVENREKFLLHAWAISRDPVIKQQLLTIKEPKYLATFDIMFSDLTEPEQQHRLMKIIESGNKLALQYWQIRQPSLLRSKEVSAEEKSDDEVGDGAFYDQKLMLFDLLENIELLYRKSVEDRGEIEAISYAVDEALIEQVRAYVAYVTQVDPQNALIPRLAFELFNRLKETTRSSLFDEDIARYLVAGALAGDVALYRELHPQLSPEHCLQYAKDNEYTAILILHTLAGLPLAESDRSFLSDMLSSITPEQQAAYRQTLAKCYLNGYGVNQDVVYANMLLGQSFDLRSLSQVEVSDIMGEAKATEVGRYAKRSLRCHVYSMCFGFTDKRIDLLHYFQKAHLSVNLLNVGCSLAAKRTGFRSVRGVKISGKKLRGSDSYFASQMVGQHLFEYLNKEEARSDLFSPNDLSNMLTNHYYSLNCQSSDDIEGILERLRRGEVVSINSGWSKGGSRHSIQFAFKMIEGQCYLMYANSGAGVRAARAGMTLYHVANPSMLSSAEFVARLVRKSSNQEYVLSQEALRDGLGKDLQLTKVGFMPKRHQENGNCAVKAAKNRIQMWLTFHRLGALAKEHGVPPNQDMFSDAYKDASTWYKPFVAFSREQSAEAAMLFCNDGFAAAVDESQRLIIAEQIIDYVEHKASTDNLHLLRLLAPVEQYLRPLESTQSESLLRRVTQRKSDIKSSIRSSRSSLLAQHALVVTAPRRLVSGDTGAEAADGHSAELRG